MLRLHWTTCGRVADAYKGFGEVEDPPNNLERLKALNEEKDLPEWVEEWLFDFDGGERLYERPPRMRRWGWACVFLFFVLIFTVFWIGPA